MGSELRAALRTPEQAGAYIERLEKRVAALGAMLRRVLDSRAAEAKATLACEVAMDNYSDAKPEMDKMQNAMVAASEIEKEARALLGERHE